MWPSLVPPTPSATHESTYLPSLLWRSLGSFTEKPLSRLPWLQLPCSPTCSVISTCDETPLELFFSRYQWGSSPLHSCPIPAFPPGLSFFECLWQGMEKQGKKTQSLESWRPAHWSRGEIRKERRETLSLQKGSIWGLGHVWGVAFKQALAELCGLNKQTWGHKKVVEVWMDGSIPGRGGSTLWGIKVFSLDVQSLACSGLAVQNGDTHRHGDLQHSPKQPFLC